MTTFPVQGIDLSRWQPTDPVETGLSFVAIRVCIGTEPDPMYATHLAHARASGLVPIAYDYGVNGLTGADQANRALAMIGTTAELVALDMEGATGPTLAEAADWLDAMERAGKVPGLYHSLSGYPTNLAPAFRWVAAWGSTPPPIPWDFWQDSDSGRFPGYLGPIDTDKYHGSLAQLRTLARIPAPTPPAHYTLAISPHAIVRQAILGTHGCIDHWVSHPWGPKASSASCGPKYGLPQCNGAGPATVTKVTDGAFAGMLVHAGGPGVTVVTS